MEIADASSQGERVWNRFIREHYPPVGSFMLAWEWGVFQRSLGRGVQYYFVKEKSGPAGKETIAAFTFVRHRLPFGFHYGYTPRGPVVQKESSKNMLQIFRKIQEWGLERHPDLIFIRLEPPVEGTGFDAAKEGFHIPDYYIQPRYNHTVPLGGTEGDVVARFHSSTRSNLGRAERRGVTVAVNALRGPADYEEFFAMAAETMTRNRVANVYPSRAYFDSLVKSILPLGDVSDPERLSIGTFSGFQNGKIAAIHFVLFFGDMATYLYGAAYTEHLSSKVTTYLHWSAMREAKRRGFTYYDLGGVDDDRWPSLTAFKRQFGGTEFSYVGNVDIPLRPGLHRIYNLLRKVRRTD